MKYVIIEKVNGVRELISRNASQFDIISDILRGKDVDDIRSVSFVSRERFFDMPSDPDEYYLVSLSVTPSMCQTFSSTFVISERPTDLLLRNMENNQADARFCLLHASRITLEEYNDLVEHNPGKASYIKMLVQDYGSENYIEEDE
jgi:hypothetical protein